MHYTADFETTTDIQDCRVWAWGICSIDEPDYFIYGNYIDDFMDYLKNANNSTFYFHNLKFDAFFILTWLFENGFTHIVDRKKARTKTFTTLISDKGQFYSIKIYFVNDKDEKITATIYDSLKIIPFSVEDVAKGFGLPIYKLSIDYKKERPIGYILSAEEITYLKHDVEIVARALKSLFEQGLTKITQGSNALFDYKKITGKRKFTDWFPTPSYSHDKDVRQAYKGGYTYLNPKFKEKDLKEGFVIDVNSLYPWVMSECKLPYGQGIFFNGKYEKDKIYELYVQMFSCQFELKEGFLPTVQLKNNLAFIPTQYLTSSNNEMVTLCMTNVDYDLFVEHYNIYNAEYHSGWKFKGSNLMFKNYVDKWIKIKNDATVNKNKSMRTLAKLMLNALYGKFALNPIVCSKIPYYEDGVVKFRNGDKEQREPLYIPVGAFVTAYARNKTIRTAQLMKDKFVYADTDSLSLLYDIPDKLKNMSQEEIENLNTKNLIEMGIDIPNEIEIDPIKLGAWKLEKVYYRARYLRQKTYVLDKNKPDTWDNENYDRNKMLITCAGMPSNCYEQVTWDNFKINSSYTGKLLQKATKGGVVLIDTEFTIRKGY